MTAKPTTIFEECKGLTGFKLTLCEQKHRPRECAGLTGHNLEHCVKYFQGAYLPECEGSPYLYLCKYSPIITSPSMYDHRDNKANKTTEPKSKYRVEQGSSKNKLIQEGVDAIFQAILLSSKPGY